MSVRLRIEHCSPISLDDESIVIGSDPTCTVPLPPSGGLQPRHAVIRKLAGRWIVEVRSAESIRVGDGPPTRMHWLSPGDVIYLGDGCPTVTYEPSGAVAVSIASMESASPPPEEARPASRFVRPMLRSDTASPGSSATIPVMPPLPEPPETKTISVSSFQNADGSSGVKVTAPDPKPPKPSEPEPDFSEPDEPAPPTPKQIKLNSWSGDSQTAAAQSRRRRALRRMLMQAAGGGVLAFVVVIVWIVAGPRSRPAVEVYPGMNNQSQSSASNQPPPTGYVLTNKKKPASSDDKKSFSTPKRDDPPKLPATADSEASPSKPRPIDTPKPDVPMSEVSKPVEPKVDLPKKPTTVTPIVPPSSALESAMNGVFAVYAKHADQPYWFRIGTAWAASRRQLVTSGAIAMASDELQRQGLEIMVSQSALERPIPVKSIRVNPAYKSAADRVSIARRQLAANPPGSNPSPKNTDQSIVPPEVELARGYSDQARFDLGILEIAMGERLRNVLDMEQGDLPDVASTQFTMLGLPFRESDYRANSTTTGAPQDRTSAPASAIKSNNDLSLSMEFPDDVAESNWSGSPVLDRNRRVIGVYSRVAPLAKGASSTSRRHAVIWLGRLREFAPEFE